MRTIEQIKEVLDRYGVKYRIGTPAESERSMSILDEAVDNFFYETKVEDEDCISREYMLKQLRKTEEEKGGTFETDSEKVKIVIEHAPSVVPSRVKGKWIMHVDDLFPCESTQECSVCHSQHLICGNDDNYCPYCGAYMKG